jgi:hypothetical protein
MDKQFLDEFKEFMAGRVIILDTCALCNSRRPDFYNIQGYRICPVCRERLAKLEEDDDG